MDIKFEPARRPTLADIIAERRTLKARTANEGEETTHLSCTPATPPIISCGSTADDTAYSHRSVTDRLNPYSCNELVVPNNVQNDKLQAVFNEENGVRRDNVRRLLEKMGLRTIPDDTILESYFRAEDDTHSTISFEQWVSLVSHLLSVAEDRRGNFSDPSSPFMLKPRMCEANSSSCVPSSKASFSGSQNQILLDKNQGINDNCSVVTHTASTGGCERFDSGESRWLTGSEDTDIALINLFIRCGGRSRKGQGLTLYIRDFDRMVNIRRGTLPPKPILRDAGSTLCAWGVHEAESTASSAQNLHLTLSRFLALLQEEVECFVNGCEDGNMTQSSLPTLCMILAAIAPAQLQRLLNRDIVELLRSSTTQERVLEALKGPDIHTICPITVFPRHVKDKQGIVPAPPSTPSQRNNTQYLRTHSALLSFLGDGLPRDSIAFSPVSAPAPDAGDAGGKKGRVDSSVVASRFSGGTRRAHGRAEVLPRYMKVKPLDEISASIIARSKARRLVDELRKNAIPINRYNCYARIEYVQKAMFDEANMSDGNYSNISPNKASRGSETCVHRLVRCKVRQQDVNGPLLPGMHRTGGLGYTQTRRARQKTFERLYRSRMATPTNYNNSLKRLAQHLAAAKAHALETEADNDTCVSHAVILTGKPATRTSDCPKKPKMRRARSLYQDRVCMRTTQRKNSQAPPMLADLYATRFLSNQTVS